VWIGEARAVLVVVTDSGQVADRTIDLVEPVSADALVRVEGLLNAALDGKVGDEVREARDGVESCAVLPVRVTAQVLDDVIDCLLEADADAVVSGGVSSLLAQPEFADPRLVGPLVHLLEDGLETLHMLTSLMQTGDVVVRIGSENPAGLDRMSVVAASYEAGGTEGVIGVIGPTRMDYARAVSAVRTVADGLTEALG
jgi:heat-inducible transcriptional repressor